MYSIEYSQEAIDDLKLMRAYDRTKVLDDIERILSVNPTLESKAVLKRLVQPAPTDFRLRVGDYRVFYDVEEALVYVERILSKQDALEYLRDPS